MRTITQENALEAALQRNEIGLYHADTILGIIGKVNPINATRIRKIKGRKEEAGFIVLLSNRTELPLFTSELPHSVTTQLDRYWPGPLTAILPKNEKISPVITGNHTSIALRLPATSIPPIPILSTSANFSGESQTWDMENIPMSVQSQLDFIYLPSPQQKKGETASTIVDFTTKHPNILRQGSLSFELY
jgi:L-threonylcarbamoyladenylate synthase